MDLCISDVRLLIRLLDKSAAIIDAYTRKPVEADKARQMRKFGKKLKKKLDERKL